MKKRTALIGLIAVAMMLPSGLSSAYDVEKGVGSQTSVTPYMTSRSADDWVFYAGGDIRRHPALVTSYPFCVGASGRLVRKDVDPPTKVYVSERVCGLDPQRVDVKPKAFTAQLAGSLPSVVYKQTWEWNKREQRWVYRGDTDGTGTVTFDLRFTGTGQENPFIPRPPVCITYFPVPCFDRMRVGSWRSATWEGSIDLRGIGRVFSSRDPGIKPEYQSSLVIWWGT